MKKNLFLFVLVFFTKTSLFALDALVNYAVFSQGDAPYIEVYLNISSKTATYKTTPDSAHLQASIDILLIFKQGEYIIKFDKYRLQSPISASPRNFYDIKRYALPVGNYQLEAQISDANSGAMPTLQKLDVKIEFEKEKLYQSDIQLLKNATKDSTGSAYAKNGLIMEPLAGNFYDKNTSTLFLYNEIYNSKNISDAFAMSYGIYNSDLHSSKVPFAVGHKKLKPLATPVVFIGQIDIAKLPSGNYNLVVEIRNRNKELLCNKEIAFQRANPFLEVEVKGISAEAIEEEFVAKMTPEELRYALKAIACKMRGEESKDLNEIIKNADLKAMKLRLFRYWATKDANHPEEAYNKYMGIARFIDQKYKSGFGYGFESDRGYVYMKYGRPDDMVEQLSNPDAAPFEIWTYYDFPITGQKNVKFIFYDAEGSGSMRMLNSTARGEIQDANWRTKLYKNTRNQWTGDGFGPTGIQDNVNRNADKLLEDW
jgi:GWxTD domain-containing protein